jgi:hypothetical protein
VGLHPQGLNAKIVRIVDQVTCEYRYLGVLAVEVDEKPT